MNSACTYGYLGALASVIWASAAHAESIPAWHVAGDGRTPGFGEYLEARTPAVRQLGHLAEAGARGGGSYGLGFELPPAILRPELGWAYSSEGGPTLEGVQGWSLVGLVELKRPVSPAFAAGEWTLNGPGFAGTLEEDEWGTGWELHSASAGHVVADFDSTTGLWTVWSSWVTYTLAPTGSGVGPDGPGEYRVVHAEDGSGNAVEYTYTGDGRIERVEYGSNPGVGAPALVRIDFAYAANDTVRSSLRTGYKVEFAFHLTYVVVSTRGSGAAAFARRSAWRFDYSSVLEQDLLTAITREGVTSALSEEIAAFDYTEFDALAPPGRVGAGPSSVQRASGNSDGGWGASHTSTVEGLFDFNRDGLGDDLQQSSTAGQWDASFQLMNNSTGDSTWGGLYTFLSDGGTLERTDTQPTFGGESNEQDTSRQVLDLDGDGYLDLLVSGDEDEWLVYYGSAGMHIDTGTVENAPAGYSYSRLGRTPNAQLSSPTTSMVTAMSDMVDVNGDGWLDLFDPYGGTVYLHAGEREGGWPTLLELDDFTPLRSADLDYDDDAFGETLADACLAGAPATCDGTCNDAWFDDQIDCVMECSGSDYGSCDAYCEDYCDGAGTDTAGETYEDCLLTCDSDCDAGDLGSCEDLCEARCFDDPEDYSCSEAQWIGDCTDECVAGASCDAYRSSRRLAETLETSGYLDINGDGLVDRVVATSDIEWQVRLGNGHGFEAPVGWATTLKYLRRTEEGTPTIDYDSAATGSVSSSGTPSRVYQALLDVDGDGLVDLVGGEELGRIWYRNLGNGFSVVSNDLPTWWPDEFVSGESESTVDADSAYSTWEQETTGVVEDANNDGVLDYVTTATISYGTYPRPYLLQGVSNPQGGSTDLDYVAASTMYPAGNLGVAQYLWRSHDLVRAITTEDAESGEVGEAWFDYELGAEEGGVFWGFGYREADHYVNGDWISTTQTEYELGRDFAPVEANVDLYTDSNLGFAPSLTRGVVTPDLRLSVETQWDDNGAHFLPGSTTVTEFGELSGSASYTRGFAWDDYGNLTNSTHDGGGVAADATVVGLAYTWDADHHFARIKSKFVAGTDPIDASYDIMAEEEYFYDGHTDKDDAPAAGLLTESKISAGWIDGGTMHTLSSEDWSILTPRGARGEMTSVTDTGTGESISQVLTFGASVVQQQENLLGQTLTWTVDDAGRTTAIEDDNGLRERSVLDAFGRPVQEFSRNAVGAEFLVRDHDYFRSAAPFRTRSRDYNFGGAVVGVSWTVEDGLGHAAQGWGQDATGHFVYTNSQIGVDGLTAASGHPVVAGFAYAPTALGIASTAGQNWYDALGILRESTPDAAKGISTSLVHLDEPRVELNEDAEGYLTRLLFDAHHRIIEVQQGRQGEMVVTARYAYDPQDRLVRFTDGAANVYVYRYDGAGRLRETQVASPAAPALRMWRAFDYQGRWRIAQHDAAGGHAQWTLDDIGRPLALDLSDPLPSAPAGEMHYAWSWDAGWVGKVDTTTDPAGTTTFGYGPFGRVVSENRSFGGGPSITYAHSYDLAGRETSRALPSGRVVQSLWNGGWLTRTQTFNGGAMEYDIQYSYNTWGKLSSAVSSFGLQFNQSYTTPVHPDTLEVRKGAVLDALTLGFQDNGFLSSRQRAGDTARTYTYDERRQLEQVHHGGALEEAFTYDGSGNLLSARDAAGATWTYGLAVQNEVPSRTTGALSEAYRYDLAGQMTGWDTGALTRELRYDGLGRVRTVTRAGVLREVFDYDANSAVVRHSEGDPIIGTPPCSWSYSGWQKESATGVITEEHTPLVATRNGVREWHFAEPDGHVASTFSDSGTLQSARRFGAFGQPQAATGNVWTRDSYHGGNEYAGGELFAMGQRHLSKKDGQWLQPEPLLYLGIPQENLANPVALASYRFAGNAPTTLTDRSGRNPAFVFGAIVYAAWETVMPVADVLSTGYAVSQGDPWSIALIEYDAASIGAGPVIPNGGATLYVVANYGGKYGDDLMRWGDDVLRESDDVAERLGPKIEEAIEAPKPHPTLSPGPHAGESIPAKSASQTFTPAERTEVNRIGQETGCHTCGTTNPGTKTGNFVPDHQPPSALVPPGTKQDLYPQCLKCSREQGLEIARQLKDKGSK